METGIGDRMESAGAGQYDLGLENLAGLPKLPDSVGIGNEPGSGIDEEASKLSSELSEALRGLAYTPGTQSSNVRNLKVIEAAAGKADEELANSSSLLDGVSGFYDSERCPWSSHEANSLAGKILEQLDPSEHDLQVLLDRHYRPLLASLAKFGSKKITRGGYRARQQLMKDSPLLGESFSESMSKRDAFRTQYIGKLNGLKLVVEKLSARSLEQNWGVIFPLAMSFLDDSDTLVRAEACHILLRIFGKADVVIRRTQVAPVIFDSLSPVLLSLPSMTPKETSEKVLPVAYQTALQLWQSAETDSGQLNLKLSMLLNDFVFPSLVKVNEIPELVLILLAVISDRLLPAAGQYRIVLQKPILYTLLGLLADPYVVFSLPVVKAVLDLIRQIWSDRILRHRYDIIGALRLLEQRLVRTYGGSRDVEIDASLECVRNTVEGLMHSLQ